MKPALLIAALLCTQSFAAPLEVHLDASTTHVSFTLGDILHTVHGEFRLKSGTVFFNSDSGAARGLIVVDATSGESGSAARDSRMHKKILESAKYPEITFAPDRVSGVFNPQAASELSVHGVFTIHGASHELTVPVHVQPQKGQLTITAKFLVPYVKWGMKNPSTFILRVNDTVEIDIDSVVRPIAAAGS